MNNEQIPTVIASVLREAISISALRLLREDSQ